MPGVIAVQDLAPRAHRQRSENVSRGVKLQWCGDALESQILLLEDGRLARGTHSARSIGTRTEASTNRLLAQLMGSYARGQILLLNGPGQSPLLRPRCPKPLACSIQRCGRIVFTNHSCLDILISVAASRVLRAVSTPSDQYVGHALPFCVRKLSDTIPPTTHGTGTAPGVGNAVS